MKQYVIAAVVVLLTMISTGISDDRKAEKPDYNTLAKKQKWQWRDDQANLMHSQLTYQGFHGIHVIRSPFTHGLKVQVKVNLWADFLFRAHRHTAFVGCSDVIYFTDYNQASSGCTVRAYDLRQCRYLWNCQLKGMGSIEHSAYRNRVRMELFEHVLMVWGNESAGRYVEIIDRKTGKTIGHKIFAKDAATAPVGTSPRPRAFGDALFRPSKTCKQWSYQLVTGRAHSRSRRTYGILKYKGREIKARHESDRIWTPWGAMDLRRGGWSPGWYPRYSMTIRKSKEIKSPDPPTSQRVKKRWLSISKGIDTIILKIEFRPGGKDAHPALRPGSNAFPSATLHVQRNSAASLLKAMTYQGFLAQARTADKNRKPDNGPCYMLHLTWKDGQTSHTLVENIGWDLPVYERLYHLRASLRNTETTPLDVILAKCRSQLEAWRLERLKSKK